MSTPAFFPLRQLSSFQRFRAKVPIAGAILTIFALLMTACGGGGGGTTGGGSTPPTGGGTNPTTLKVSASPATIQASSGNSAMITIDITLQTGYSGGTTATVSGLPAGITVAVPQPIALGAGPQQIPISCDGTTPAGTYTLTLTITAGTQTTSTTFSLVVSAAAGNSLAATISSPTVMAGQGAQISVTVTVPNGFNGAVTGTVTGLPSGVTLSSAQPIPLLPGTQLIAVGAGSTATPGSYPITLNVTAGTLMTTASGTLTVTAAGPAALGIPVNSLFLSPGNGNSIDLECLPAGGTGTCTLSTTITGLPAGVSVNPSMPFNVTTAGTVITFTASSSVAAGQYPITFVGTVGTFQATYNITLVVGYADYWFLSYTPIPLVVRFGSQSSVTLQTGSGAGGGLQSNYTLTMSVSGLPPGTTGTLTPSVISPGQSTVLTVAAASNAPINRNYSVEVTATPSISSEQPQSVQLDVSVVPAVGSLPNDRSDYVETDGEVVSAVYDATHQVVFASVPNWDVVDVISPATKKIVNSIPIPAPHTLSWSLDGTHILVGTNTAQIFWIDPSTMRVDKKLVLPQPDPQSYAVSFRSASELADGTLLIGGSSLIFNPATNSFNSLPLGNVGGPVDSVVSADGRKILCKEEQGSSVQLYDVAAGMVTQTLNFPQAVGSIAINPTGTRFLISDYTRGVGIYDQNLALINPIVPVGTGSEPAGLLFSSDGTRAYIFDQAVYTYDMGSDVLLGLAPELPGIPLTSDNTGLTFLDTSYGLMIDDTANFVSRVVIPPFLNSPMPGYGAVGQATTVTFNFGLAELPDIYFGGILGSQESLAVGTGEPTVTTPAITQPGPVNMKAISPEGGVAIQPLAFTYGPWIQFLRGSAGDPAGGVTASLVALGVPSDGSGVQVTVGGATATGVQVSALPQYLVPNAYPALLVTFTVPPGAPGPADVTLTTSDGSSTLPKAFHYLASVSDYSSADTFADVLFDKARNQLYLTAGDHVDVFSLSSNSFTGTLIPNSLSGQKSLTGLALTPDGSKLVVGNKSDNSIAVIDLNTQSNAGVFSLPAPTFSNCVPASLELAATNDGRAAVAINNGSNGCALPNISLVDLASGQITTPIPSSCFSSQVAATSDGSVVGAFGGSLCVFHTADSSVSSTIVTDTVLGGAVSGDGNIFAMGNSYFLDSAMNLVDESSGFGATILLHPDLPSNEILLNNSGSLAYTAYNSSFDVVDVAHGTLRSWVALKENVRQNLPAPFTIDDEGKRIFALTDKGLTIVQLDAVPLSIGSVSPASASTGSTVTVHGSGFDANTSAMINGVAATAVVVDSSTLQVTLPSVGAGAAEISVATPSGQSYKMEAAFVVK